MLTAVGENIATIFTLLTFILIILAPMAMAFMRTKEKRSHGKQPREAAPTRGAGTTGKPAKTARKPRDLLFDLLRRADREDEAEVRFTTPETGQAKIGQSAEKKESPRLGKTETSQDRPVSPSMGTEFRAFDSELGEPFQAIGSGSVPQASGSGTVTAAGLPRTQALGKLARLPELQRAIVLAELLGRPKALRESDDLHG